ncbi:MAG: 2-hydroxychromene-2-carboxylate isomerase [Myxococcota bacterium]
MRVEFFYDLGSPYTYLAFTQIEAMAARHDAELVWRPFLLGGVFKATGSRPPIEIGAKARGMGRDLLRWAAQYRVPFAFPPIVPPRTLRAMRMCVAAEGVPSDRVRHPRGALVPFTRAAFVAAWVEARDISEDAVLAGAARSAGLDGAALLAEADAPAVKDRLRAHTDEAVARGAFGAPTFFVEDEMYWGNDRLHQVEAHLAGKKL